MERALGTISQELDERLKELKDGEHLLEAQRLEQRTRYDMEMMEEMATARASKTIPATWQAVKPARRRIPFWTISRTTS